MTTEDGQTYLRFNINRPCPKCGSGPTPSVYCSTRLVEVNLYVKGHYFDVPEGGHMHRKCLHCGHERVELALDTPLMAEETRVRVLAELQAERRRHG